MEEDDAGLFGDLDFDFGGYNITVEMPGTITSVEGTNVEQTSDTSFEIQAGLNDTFDVVVTSEDGSSSFPTFLLIIAIIVVLAVAAIIALLLTRKRKNNDDTTATVTSATIVVDPSPEPGSIAPPVTPNAIDSAPESPNDDPSRA